MFDFEAAAKHIVAGLAGEGDIEFVAARLRQTYEAGRRDENKACADECHTHGIHAQGWATAAGCRERIQKRMPNATLPKEAK